MGEISDRAARKMSKDGFGKMFCMTGIGGRVSGIIKTTEAASEILAIDGCSLNCVKNSLEQAGFQEFKHLQLADIDMKKGETPATEENISKAAAKGAEMLT